MVVAAAAALQQRSGTIQDEVFTQLNPTRLIGVDCKLQRPLLPGVDELEIGKEVAHSGLRIHLQKIGLSSRLCGRRKWM